MSRAFPAAVIASRKSEESSNTGGHGDVGGHQAPARPWLKTLLGSTGVPSPERAGGGADGLLAKGPLATVSRVRGKNLPDYRTVRGRVVRPISNPLR